MSSREPKLIDVDGHQVDLVKSWDVAIEVVGSLLRHGKGSDESRLILESAVADFRHARQATEQLLSGRRRKNYGPRVAHCQRVHRIHDGRSKAQPASVLCCKPTATIEDGFALPRAAFDQLEPRKQCKACRMEFLRLTRRSS